MSFWVYGLIYFLKCAKLVSIFSYNPDIMATCLEGRVMCAQESFDLTFFGSSCQTKTLKIGFSPQPN